MPGYVSNPFWPPPVKETDSKATTVDTPPSQAATPAPKEELHPVMVAAQKAASAPLPENPSHEGLTLLHNLGKFFLDDLLPVVLQVGLPILAKRI